MANHGSRISLLEAEPDLAGFMTAEEQAAARKVSVPVMAMPRGPLDLDSVLQSANAFGALVLDGMLFSHHGIGDHTALRLLGPGDLLARPGTWRSTILPATALSAAAPTTVALLGTELLLAAHRWPRIVAALYVRISEQSDRVAAQLAICQLPRVDQRLLGVLWLLAESWGRVTPAGTRLPLTLTHDALGALIGARRPTVTLALGELTERGAIVRQDRGWLLLEAPVQVRPEPAAPPGHDVLLGPLPEVWSPDAPAPVAEVHDQLLATVKQLRAEHLASRDHMSVRLAELARLRAEASELRRRIADEALSRRRGPS